MTQQADAAEILAHHTGGGHAWTRAISQRIGVVFTLAGLRRGWSPASVTLAALVASLGTSAAVLVLGHGVAAAIVAAVGWQVAYGLDCSDGQLARVTGRTSVAGAALDLYCDWLSRGALVAVLLIVLADGTPDVWPWVAALVMAGQLSGLFHQAVRQSGAVEDLPRTLARRLLGVARDPGLLFAVYAVTLALGPRWILGALAYGAVMGALQFVVRLSRLVMQARRA